MKLLCNSVIQISDHVQYSFSGVTFFFLQDLQTFIHLHLGSLTWQQWRPSSGSIHFWFHWQRQWWRRCDSPVGWQWRKNPCVRRVGHGWDCRAPVQSAWWSIWPPRCLQVAQKNTYHICANYVWQNNKQVIYSVNIFLILVMGGRYWFYAQSMGLNVLHCALSYDQSSVLYNRAWKFADCCFDELCWK